MHSTCIWGACRRCSTLRSAPGSAALLSCVARCCWSRCARRRRRNAGSPNFPSVLDVRVSTTPQRARLILDLSGKTEFALVSLDRPGPDRGRREGHRPQDRGRSAAGCGHGHCRELHARDGRAGQGAGDPHPGAAGAGPAGLCARRRSPTSRRGLWSISSSIRPRDLPSARRTTLRRRWRRTRPGHRRPCRARRRCREPEVLAVTRPLVVIDPGHGGIDNGATAPNGVHEKDIVLAYRAGAAGAARRVRPVRRGADARGRQLPEARGARGAGAREQGRPLHLDPRRHASSRPKSAAPASIPATRTRPTSSTRCWRTTRTASTRRRLRGAGHAADGRRHPRRPDAPARCGKQSFVAAQAIVQQLEPSVALRRFPVRQADFFVLQAPDVPSVLIELGFLSNAADIVNLQQRRLARPRWSTRWPRASTPISTAIEAARSRQRSDREHAHTWHHDGVCIHISALLWYDCTAESGA